MVSIIMNSSRDLFENPERWKTEKLPNKIFENSEEEELESESEMESAYSEQEYETAAIADSDSDEVIF